MRDWLVHIRRHNHSSLQTQIREALVAAILDGQLTRDEPIPSTRKMAKSLGVSRNTVRNQLAAVFDKMGTRRRTELVATIVNALGPVAAKSDDRHASMQQAPRAVLSRTASSQPYRA